MLKIAAIASIVLSGLGVVLYWFIGADAFVFAPMECDEKELKAHRKVFLIYTAVLFSLLALTVVLNYLCYNK